MVSFAKIMVDEVDGFSRSLEELALKKATNIKIFRYVKVKFDEARKERIFMNKMSSITLPVNEDFRM